MSEGMSEERLAHLRAVNEPVGDHLSGLTADEVAELIAEVDALRGISDQAIRAQQYGAQLMNERNQARADLEAMAEDLQESRDYVAELQDDGKRWQKEHDQARAELAEMREKLVAIYSPGDERGPYTDSSYTLAAAQAVILDGGSVWTRLVGSWREVEGGDAACEIARETTCET